jgi:hypothetical protein
MKKIIKRLEDIEKHVLEAKRHYGSAAVLDEILTLAYDARVMLEQGRFKMEHDPQQKDHLEKENAHLKETLDQVTADTWKFAMAKLINECHATARAKGFHDDMDPHDVHRFLAMMALVHSEISEAVAEVREHGTEEPASIGPRLQLDEKPVGVVVELADAVIRIFDTVGALGWTANFLLAFERKMAYNRLRPHKHGRLV